MSEQATLTGFDDGCDIRSILDGRSLDLGDLDVDFKNLDTGLVTPAMRLAQQEWLATFYGRPAWAEPGKTHLCGFAGIVAGTAATLSANEIVLGCETQGATQSGLAQFVRGQLDANLLPGLHGAVQLAATGGWVAVRPLRSGGQIVFDVLPPGRFTPLRMAGGRVEAAVFTDWDVLEGKPVARLEIHDTRADGAHIANLAVRVGRGRPERIPLASVRRWAGIAPCALVRGVRQPLFGVLRMPFANTVEPGSPLPVALYADAMGSLREIDHIFTEFLWEMKSGHRRQILDITAVQPRQARGGGTAYEPGEQYLLLDMGGRDVKPYDDYTPELRVDAYQNALNIQLRLLERQCGLSSGSLAFDVRRGVGLGRNMTATEVVSEDKETYNTIAAIQRHGLRQGLLDVISAAGTLAAAYGLAPAGRLTPQVAFGDSVFEDTGTEFARRKALADAGYITPQALTDWYFGHNTP